MLLHPMGASRWLLAASPTPHLAAITPADIIAYLRTEYKRDCGGIMSRSANRMP